MLYVRHVAVAHPEHAIIHHPSLVSKEIQVQSTLGYVHGYTTSLHYFYISVLLVALLVARNLQCMCSQYRTANVMLHRSLIVPVFRYLGAGATDSDGAVDPKVAAALLAAKGGRRRSGHS